VFSGVDVAWIALLFLLIGWIGRKIDEAVARHELQQDKEFTEGDQ
jgi:hypothetical protein